MSRDYGIFPDDENGDVLWRMQEAGDHLSTAREIDFVLVFPTEKSALEFAVHLLKHGQRVSLSEYEEREDLPWQVHAHPIMVPTHGNIASYEKQLEIDSSKFGGRNDGWGCFQQDS